VFSARDPTSLDKLVESYKEFLECTSIPLKNIAYTLGSRREHMLFRTSAVTSGESFQVPPSIKSNLPLVPALVFTGQGAQWPEMGKELIADYDSFREDIRKMDRSLSQLKQAPSWKLEGLYRFYTKFMLTARNLFNAMCLQMNC
jgi:acyl transferase domain-containing protein